MDVIQKYFPSLADHQLKQFSGLYPLYKDWNSKINVISRKDIDELYTRHVLHSLSIAKLNSFAPGTWFLDLGTGGGFPGIPLAIMFPKCHFVLVDSIAKKIKVVNEIVKHLGLENITSQCKRGEKVNGLFDFVITRAVASAKLTYSWSHSQISDVQKNQLGNGIIALKGGDLDQELIELKHHHQLIQISEYFTESFFETKKILYIPV